MNAKGSAGFIIYATLGIIILGGLIFIWGLKTRLDTIEPQQSPVPAPTRKADPTRNWKVYSNGELGITLKYPSDWGVNDDMTLSQFRHTNIIVISKITRQILPGSYNIDLFEKLYSIKPNEKIVQDYFKTFNNNEIVKLESGKLNRSNRYVIYTVVSENTPPKKPIAAIVFIGDYGIQLSLAEYDDYGLETFKQIVKTAVLTKQ